MSKDYSYLHSQECHSQKSAERANNTKPQNILFALSKNSQIFMEKFEKKIKKILTPTFCTLKNPSLSYKRAVAVGGTAHLVERRTPTMRSWVRIPSKLRKIPYLEKQPRVMDPFGTTPVLKKPILLEGRTKY